jgi:predicted transglutaminase-like cysteine proteinase
VQGHLGRVMFDKGLFNSRRCHAPLRRPALAGAWAAGTLLLAALCGPATARPIDAAEMPAPLVESRFLSRQGSLMGEGAPTLAPLAAVKFCMQYGDQCSGDRAARISLNDRELALLGKVNRAVNRAIRPAGGERGLDTWLLEQTAGHCNEYAVQKRHDLLAAGFPPSALLLASAVTSFGVNHLVLIVSTDRGDFVLDNLRDDIRPWNRTGYRWLARQSHRDPNFWVEISASAVRVASLPVVVVGEKPAPALAQAPAAEPAPAEAADVSDLPGMAASEMPLLRDLLLSRLDRGIDADDAAPPEQGAEIVLSDGLTQPRG